MSFHIFEKYHTYQLCSKTLNSPDQQHFKTLQLVQTLKSITNKIPSVHRILMQYSICPFILFKNIYTYQTTVCQLSNMLRVAACVKLSKTAVRFLFCLDSAYSDRADHQVLEQSHYFICKFLNGKPKLNNVQVRVKFSSVNILL